MRDRLLNPPAQRPTRTRSASPPSPKRKLSEREQQRPVRRRRNSAGPLFSSTPYSLSVDYVDRRTGKNQDHFVETLTRHSNYSPRFQTSREVTAIALRHLDQCESPEELLVGAFARCIREAYAKYPDIIKYGVTIESGQLDYPVDVPFRSKWQNSPGAILNEFNRVAQSKQHANLFGAPIKIAVTAIRGRAGSGYSAAAVSHNINEKSLIKIVNPSDNYCMLYALELSRLHLTLNKPGALTSKEFHKILKKGTQWSGGSRGFKSKLPTMSEIVDQLFANCPQLPRGLPAYSMEQHLPLVQDAYNRLYPGKYRIIAFDQFGHYQPCYKGPPAEYDVCIVHHGHRSDGTAHFNGVRCVNTLFGKAYYCPDCERAFGKKIKHSGKCIRKCCGCGGFGSEFPCRGGLKIKCSDCNKTFVNRECYERHFSSMCARFHVCKDCGVTYDVKATKRLTPNKEHECGQLFCQHCCMYHRTGQPCYIQPIEPKDAEKPYRIVAYDFECSQHNRPDPEKEWYLHEVNCVCAQVTCSQCVDWTGLDWAGLECDWKDLSKKRLQDLWSNEGSHLEPSRRKESPKGICLLGTLLF